MGQLPSLKGKESKKVLLIYDKREAQQKFFLTKSHLKKLDKEFQLKREKNTEIGLKIISEVFSNASEKQINSFKRRIETFIASIDRILANRSLD